MAINTQSKKWQITVNNATEHGLTHERIAELLSLFCPTYYCMADEIAESGTAHTHLFLLCSSPVRFSTIKGRFPAAHVEKCHGSSRDNVDYIKKEGRWADSVKAETSIKDSFTEWGNMPNENEEKSPCMTKLIQSVENGMTNKEIISETPSFAFRIRDIDILRQTYISEKYMREYRQVKVWYLYGATGTGKTRSIYEKYPATDICRITDYSRNGVKFDAYKTQPVIVFEEFCSQVDISEMLNLLDQYPLMLPARYNDRVACYSHVFITSNLPLSAQYEKVQRSSPETWRAFLRRIHKVVEFGRDGIQEELQI